MNHRSNLLRAVALSLLPDPFYRSITEDFADSEEDRLAVLMPYLDYSLAEAARTGVSLVAPPPRRAATAWLLPRASDVDAVESKAKAAFIAGTLGPLGCHNYHAIIGFMAPRAASHVPDDAWYLSIIGVHPAEQGSGLGEALLRPTLQQADRQRACCYLETFTPRNVGFYQRLGFAVVAEYAEPTTGASYLIMRRGA